MGDVKAVTADSFDAAVLGANSPVLVDFYADWCQPCKMLEPTLRQLAGEYGSAVDVVRLDIDANQSVAQRYGVQSIPQLLLFVAGEQRARIVGAKPKREIRRQLDSVLVAAGALAAPDVTQPVDSMRFGPRTAELEAALRALAALGPEEWASVAARMQDGMAAASAAATAATNGPGAIDERAMTAIAAVGAGIAQEIAARGIDTGTMLVAGALNAALLAWLTGNASSVPADSIGSFVRDLPPDAPSPGDVFLAALRELPESAWTERAVPLAQVGAAVEDAAAIAGSVPANPEQLPLRTMAAATLIGAIASRQENADQSGALATAAGGLDPAKLFAGLLDPAILA